MTSAREGIGMYGDILDLHLLLWSALLVDGNLLQVVEHVPAVEELAKDGVLAVEVRGRRESDEELAPVCIGALVGHADNASGVVAQSGADLVFEELSGRVVDGGRRLGFWI